MSDSGETSLRAEYERLVAEYRLSDYEIRGCNLHILKRGIVIAWDQRRAERIRYDAHYQYLLRRGPFRQALLDLSKINHLDMAVEYSKQSGNIIVRPRPEEVDFIVSEIDSTIPVSNTSDYRHYQQNV